MVGELTDAVSSTSSASMGGLFAIIMVLIVVMILIIIALYVYSAWAWMTIAKKTKTEPAWLAWIPVANNVLMSRIAEMHWWPILMLVPALIFVVLFAIFPTLIIFLILYAVSILVMAFYFMLWTWKAFEKVGRPGWWALVAFVTSLIATPLMLIGTPVCNIIGWIVTIVGGVWSLIVLGIAAWGRSPSTVSKSETRTQTVKETKPSKTTKTAKKKR